MAVISAALKKLIENSDDLSTLPQLVAQVEALEASEEQYQVRIAKLQEINKSYLAQIPIPDDKPTGDDQKDEEPTLQDASDYLVNFLKGDE
jgi:hypothetical protein